jgi:predicted ferric reductase
MTAVDVSGTIALGAIGLLTANLLLGLLLSVGYNPARQWPRQRMKLFTLHNWTGYVAFAAVALHAGALLFSSAPRFRLYDILVPIESPVQPLSNNLGALGFYLVAIVVVTSLRRVRSALGRHWWKLVHYTTYAAGWCSSRTASSRIRYSRTGRSISLTRKRSTWSFAPSP